MEEEISIEEYMLDMASGGGYIRAFMSLIEEGADIYYKDKNHGRTAMHYAILDDSFDIAKYCIEKYGLDLLFIKDNEGFTAIDFLVIGGCSEKLYDFLVQEKGLKIKYYNNCLSIEIGNRSRVLT